jgi:hypothetical protein
METKRPMAAAEDAPAGRKRRKQAKARAAADGAWERCMFRVVRKDRFCNIQRCVAARTTRLSQVAE